jgi:hypothetical protein
MPTMHTYHEQRPPSILTTDNAYHPNTVDNAHNPRILITNLITHYISLVYTYTYLPVIMHHHTCNSNQNMLTICQTTCIQSNKAAITMMLKTKPHVSPPVSKKYSQFLASGKRSEIKPLQ